MKKNQSRKGKRKRGVNVNFHKPRKKQLIMKKQPVPPASITDRLAEMNRLNQIFQKAKKERDYKNDNQ